MGNRISAGFRCRRGIVLMLAALAFSASAASAADADYSGQYSGTALSVELVAAGNGYTGTIQLGTLQFPLKASVQNGILSGTFSSQGNSFPFTATLQGNHMSLTSGGRAYEMDRPAAAPNPLTNPPANPLASATTPGSQVAPFVPAMALSSPANSNNAQPNATQVQSAPAANSDIPQGYTRVASIGTGRTFFTQKLGVATIQSAIRATMDDLTTVFQAKPSITSAFADSQGTHGGGAIFSAQKDGKAIKGWVICGLDDKGAAITVMYDQSDASGDEWSKLLASLPSQSKLQDYQFADGTGSVGIPPNWKTSATTCIGGVRIEGPGNQVVTLGQGLEVITPNSTLVRMHAQLAAQARQLGSAPPPPILMLIAPFCGPADALRYLMPQISQFSQQAGGPSLRLDRIIEATNCQAHLPNGQAAQIYYSYFKGDGDNAVRYRTAAQIECYPILDGQNSWGVFFTALAAPDTTFDTDLPIMLNIARSLKVNDEQVANVTSNIIQRNNQQFAAFEQAQREKSEAFDSFEQSMRNRELVEERSNADFDEVIRGYRTVMDTGTGDKSSVDLGSVDGVVNALNEHDPGRYVEIPLRDEVAPAP